MLRSSPSADSSSQHTLLTPYRSGAETPEEEEELALLQRLEQQQQNEYQNIPQMQQSQAASTAWVGGPAQAGSGLPSHLVEGGTAEDEPWQPGAGASSMSGEPDGWHPPQRGAFPGGDDPPQPESTPGQWPGAGGEDAAGGELPEDTTTDEGSGHHNWRPGLRQSAPGWQQNPQTMAPPATPAVPPATGARTMDGPPPPRQAQQPDGSEGAAPRPAAPRPQTGQVGRDDRAGRARPGLDILGQPAPAPRLGAIAGDDDTTQKWYDELKPGANAVVLYNRKAPPGNFQGTQTSNGTTFEQQGMKILGDHSGNASENPRMIDISDPNWIRKLDALVASQGGRKFEHVYVIDHGNIGRVSFGKHPEAYPPYPDFIGLGKDSIGTRVIASVLADKGALHLGSCFTARDEAGRQYLNDLYKVINRGNNISIDAITGSMRNSLNQYEGRRIRVPEPATHQPPPPHEKR